jgi:hypothetical protein
MMVLELMSNVFVVCNCALQLGEFCVMLMEEMRTQKRRVGTGIVVIAFSLGLLFTTVLYLIRTGFAKASTNVKEREESRNLLPCFCPCMRPDACQQVNEAGDELQLMAMSSSSWRCALFLPIHQ